MNHPEEDAQIAGAVERLFSGSSEHWRRQLNALRAAVDREIAAIEATIDQRDYTDEMRSAVQHVSRLAVERADRERHQNLLIAGQSLAAIESALHARLDSEMETNAILRKALSEARQEIDSLKTAAAPAPADPQRKPLQFSEPARDARRVKIRRGVFVKVDGVTGEVVDLSMGGAQLLLAQGIKPNQLVRVVLPASGGDIICRGRIVWAVYEQHATSVSVYRSGVKFTDADASTIEQFMNDFCTRPTLGQLPQSSHSAARTS
jgi:PilZ domain